MHKKGLRKGPSLAQCAGVVLFFHAFLLFVTSFNHLTFRIVRGLAPFGVGDHYQQCSLPASSQF